MQKNQTNKTSFSFNPFHILFAIFFFLALRACMETNATQRLNFTEFKEALENSEIKDVTIRGETISGNFVRPRDNKTKFTTIYVKPEITDLFEKQQIPIESLGSQSPLTSMLFLLLPTALFIGFWWFIIRRGMKGLSSNSSPFMSVGKSKAKIYIQKETHISFKDVAGADEALEELKEVIDFLKNAEKTQSLGGKMPKGILLVGPPGTGKTLLAKAIAGEAGVPFFSTNGAEFVEMFVGVGAARVRDLFEQAQRSAPCIIFIDELDALGKTRHSNIVGGNDEKEQTLNQLLVEMDGFDTRGGIIILAATNRPEMIDPALIRSGRFDRQVVIDRPDKKGRFDILKIHLEKIKSSPQLDIHSLAALTPGFTGADLANLVNEAALIATRENKSYVEQDHFTRAMERIVAGIEKKTKVIRQQEKEIIAFHEMGHALTGYAFNKSDTIHKVSIIPHGLGSMGHTIQHPNEDKYIMGEDDLFNKMTILLGGRAAEFIIFKKYTTGAADDLVKATQIAKEMVTRYGMSESLGHLSYDKGYGHRFYQDGGYPLDRNDYSEETAKKIDQEIYQLMSKAFEKSYHFLEHEKDLLIYSSKLLIEKETLNENDLKIIFQKIPPTQGSQSYENFMNHHH